MARTYANLWPRVVHWNALLAAYQACRRRKRHTSLAVQFDFNWEEELWQLQRELLRHEYEPGDYHHFHLSDPKPRRISAAPFRDRIVHHALVRVLEPIYERRFIHDSYACRRRKGTHRAVERAQFYLQRHEFYLKSDVVQFFPSVDHRILSDLIRRTVRDDSVLNLIELILASGTDVHAEQRQPTWFAGDDLFAALRPKGLPIGNLTSQFFANVLLDQLDHFVKEVLRVPGYVRYADDVVLFGPSKLQLRDWLREVTGFLAELRLRLHQEKTQVASRNAGLTFLGLRLGRDRRPRLSSQRVSRFTRRLRRQQREFAAGTLKPEEVSRSLQAWLAGSAVANTHGLRRDLWRRVSFRRSPQ